MTFGMRMLKSLFGIGEIISWSDISVPEKLIFNRKFQLYVIVNVISLMSFFLQKNSSLFGSLKKFTDYLGVWEIS